MCTPLKFQLPLALNRVELGSQTFKNCFFEFLPNLRARCARNIVFELSWQTLDKELKRFFPCIYFGRHFGLAKNR